MTIPDEVTNKIEKNKKTEDSKNTKDNNDKMNKKII